MIGTARGGAGQRIDRKFPLGPRGVPMLSSLTSWDVGTAGSWDGGYALKIPTIAQARNKGLIVSGSAARGGASSGSRPISPTGGAGGTRFGDGDVQLLSLRST